MSETHATNITGRIRLLTLAPSDPVIGDMYFDTTQDGWFRWSGNTWIGFNFSGTQASTPAQSGESATHFSSLTSVFRTATSAPTDPQEGDFYYDTSSDILYVREGGAWFSAQFTTTTSTSTSTTTTSTSTTTTSTSTTTSSSTSSSTTTSTTTTL